MRKIISFLIILAILITLTSCNTASNTDTKKDTTNKEVIKQSIKKEENVRKGWLLEGIPSYEGGVSLSRELYNNGPGLMNDAVAKTEEDSFMQIVARTNADEFKQYLNKLSEYGFEKVYEGQTEGNLYAEYSGGDQLVYAYYIESLKEARIIDDNCSVPLNDFAYTVESNGSATVYQYGMFYAGNSNTTMNCGMIYVIKLSDNSLFLVDGGHPYQATDKATEGLMNFLREITGVKEGEKMNIAAWFITHAHNDHLSLPAKILHQYHNEFNLQRVMYNFPSFQTVRSGYSAFTISWTKQMLSKFHSNAKFLKPYMGMKFNLADMNIEVMFSQENGVKAATSKQSISNFNSTTTVLRLTFDNGKSVMMLGDTDTEAEKIITEMYTDPNTFKSDIVQVTHHNFNYLRTLYGWIAPSIAIVPNSKSNAMAGDNANKLKDVTKHTGNDNVYYEGSGTYGFQVVDGEWKLVYESKVIGGAYDKSGM